MHHTFQSPRQYLLAHCALFVALGGCPPSAPAATRPATAPAAAATRPSTRPLSAAEAARLRRGAEVRRALHAALEQAFAAGGWPQTLPPPPAGGPKLIYARPDKLPDGQVSEVLAMATAVVHEPVEEHPGGVWVGFADGRLEFAASAADLAEVKGQAEVVRAAIAAHTHPIIGAAAAAADGKPAAPATAASQPATVKPRGELRLRVLDPDGKPVAGARVGNRGRFGDLDTPDERVVSWADDVQKDEVISTAANGEATMRARHFFGADFSAPADQPAAGLYVLHEGRGLVALEEVRPSEFGGGKVRDVTLRPACRVSGTVTSVAFHEAGRGVGKVWGMAYKPGQFNVRSLGSLSAGGRFEFLLPPGDFGIWVNGTDTYVIQRFVRVAPGRRELNLNIDLGPQANALLPGRPAPELRGIKGWKNGGPVKLADLRGKVVLLEFWGHWCGPCIGSMPHLMKIHDEFKDRGLVVVAVHDDSADSVEDMDRKLEKAREKFWGGRDLPFLVALDGGGPTRMPGGASTARGATTAAYGITSFPTTLLVGPDGTVLREVNLRTGEAHAEVEKLLQAKESPAR